MPDSIMTTSNLTTRIVPAIAARPRTSSPFLLAAILSKWPLIWARGGPDDAASLPDRLRRDIGLPAAEPQRRHWDYL